MRSVIYAGSLNTTANNFAASTHLKNVCWTSQNIQTTDVLFSPDVWTWSWVKGCEDCELWSPAGSQSVCRSVGGRTCQPASHTLDRNDKNSDREQCGRGLSDGGEDKELSEWGRSRVSQEHEEGDRRGEKLKPKDRNGNKKREVPKNTWGTDFTGIIKGRCWQLALCKLVQHYTCVSIGAGCNVSISSSKLSLSTPSQSCGPDRRL